MGEAAEYEDRLNAGWYDEPGDVGTFDYAHVRRCVACLEWFLSISAGRMVCSPDCQRVYNRERAAASRNYDSLKIEKPLRGNYGHPG